MIYLLYLPFLIIVNKITIEMRGEPKIYETKGKISLLFSSQLLHLKISLEHYH